MKDNNGGADIPPEFDEIFVPKKFLEKIIQRKSGMKPKSWRLLDGDKVEINIRKDHFVEILGEVYSEDIEKVNIENGDIKLTTSQNNNGNSLDGESPSEGKVDERIKNSETFDKVFVE
jgi:hypothetical protein